MAITKTMNMKASGKGKIGIHLEHAINYILQTKKLGNSNLTGGINCLPDSAYEQMKATKQMFGKEGGRQGYHFVISLKPGEGIPEEMYDIAMRFAERAFGGEYEAVVAVHTDRNHLHAHIVINSVNMVTGYKFQYNNGDWKYKFQPITNKLCEEYGLHVTPAEYSKEATNVSRPQWEREQTFSKWIEQDARFCALNAENMKHFIFLLEKQGFEVKQGEHIAIKVPGMKRFKRLDTISEDFSRENLEAMFQYGDASMAFPVNHAMPLIPIRKTILTPYQRKCYARMYRLRLAEKKRFTYKSAYLYEQIRKMHELQEEYLVVVNYGVGTFGDLYKLKLRLQNVDEELCKVQKEMYRNRASQKKSCKTVEDMAIFEASEDDYKDSLEQIKIQKQANHKKLKAVERCLEREGSMADAELEYRIPVGDMEDVLEMDKLEVPRNPQRMNDETVTEEMISEMVVDEFFDVDVLRTDIDETVVSDCSLIDVEAEELTDAIKNIEPDLQKSDVSKYENMKLPSNKADYMRMSVAEKVRCYPFDIKGTDLAFEMVKTYFETVGLETDFHTVYEETKLLTYYYEERKAEELLQKQVEQIIGTIELVGIDSDRLTEYSANVLSEVFGFGDMEYFNGIKLFNKVIDRLGVDIDQQNRYEMFARIYEGGIKKRDYEYNRYIR